MKRSLSIVSILILIIAGAAPAQDKPKSTTETITIPNSTVKFDLVQLPAGKITVKDKDGKDTVQEIKPVWIGKLEVSWDEYDVFWQRLDLTPAQIVSGFDAENRPSKPYSAPDRGFGHSGWPAGSVTFLEAQKYVTWLSKKTGKKYRLPTSAEWEYAAKAGGDGKPAKVGDAAWHANNSDEMTHPVGKKQANAWGLHDMLGNVAEWVTTPDGTGAVAGGSYIDEPADISVGQRQGHDPAWQRDDPQDPKGKSWLSNGAHIGIRVVREE